MKEYRQNAHVVSLVVWAVLCIGVAFFLFAHSRKIVDRPLQVAEIVGGIALLIFGPVALAVYLIRSELLRVTVDPGRGLLVGQGRVIDWDAIVRVERRRPKLRRSTGPARLEGKAKNPLGVLDAGSGCVPGEFAGCGEGGLLVVGIILLLLAVFLLYWLVFLVLIPLLVVPLLEVFAPFGDRVKIVTRGRPLILRDLREADAFLEEVRSRVQVVER